LIKPRSAPPPAASPRRTDADARQAEGRRARAPWANAGSDAGGAAQRGGGSPATLQNLGSPFGCLSHSPRLLQRLQRRPTLPPRPLYATSPRAADPARASRGRRAAWARGAARWGRARSARRRARARRTRRGAARRGVRGRARRRAWAAAAAGSGARMTSFISAAARTRSRQAAAGACLNALTGEGEAARRVQRTRARQRSVAAARRVCSQRWWLWGARARQSGASRWGAGNLCAGCAVGRWLRGAGESRGSEQTGFIKFVRPCTATASRAGVPHREEHGTGSRSLGSTSPS